MDLQGSELHLLDYWPTLLRRRWVVYLSLIACALVALIGSMLTTPEYQATSVIQIERHNPEILTHQDLSRVDYSWAAYSDFYQTQYKIIASSRVARWAVEEEGLIDHPGFAVPDSPGLLARIQAFLPSSAEAGEIDEIEIAAATVLAGLEVTPVRDSHLVEISWTSVDPELAALVANALADAYIQVNAHSQYNASEEAEKFLNQQIIAVKNEIREFEDKLQTYGEANRILSIDDTGNSSYSTLNDIAEQLTAAETQLAHSEAAYRAALEAVPDSLPEVRNSTLIARLRGEYAGYEADLMEKSKRFKADWPGMITLRSRLEQARERLQIETSRIVAQVRAATEAGRNTSRDEVANLRRLLRSHEDAAQQLKKKAGEYANLDSDVRKKRETLNTLIERQNEMALSSQLKALDALSLNVQVMERARVPRAPFRPRTKRNLALGLMLGLVLGVVGALGLDHLDNSIGSPAEMKQLLPHPLLAVIPRHGQVNPKGRRKPAVRVAETIDLIAHRDGRAAASEAYRELRTSILLSNPGSQPRLIMVTSALPEEGKTATALNLAAVLAQLGRRVLIVDTDLRRPRLHTASGIKNQRGVTTYLSGLESDASGLSVPSGIENLDLLPSGPIPPNPSELLNSDVFARMAQELLDSGYDHLVFDSPPALSVSDPVIISQIVQAVVLVVRAGRTPRQSVRAAAEKIFQSVRGSFGVVLNDLDPEILGKDHYQYYGRYGGPEQTESTEPVRTAGGGA